MCGASLRRPACCCADRPLGHCCLLDLGRLFVPELFHRSGLRPLPRFAGQGLGGATVVASAARRRLMSASTRSRHWDHLRIHHSSRRSGVRTIRLNRNQFVGWRNREGPLLTVSARPSTAAARTAGGGDHRPICGVFNPSSGGCDVPTPSRDCRRRSCCTSGVVGRGCGLRRPACSHVLHMP